MALCSTAQIMSHPTGDVMVKVDYNKIGRYLSKTNPRNCHHAFTIKTDRCEHKHCRKCGICQAINGCAQKINEVNGGCQE